MRTVWWRQAQAARGEARAGDARRKEPVACGSALASDRRDAKAALQRDDLRVESRSREAHQRAADSVRQGDRRRRRREGTRALHRADVRLARLSFSPEDMSPELKQLIITCLTPTNTATWLTLVQHALHSHSHVLVRVVLLFCVRVEKLFDRSHFKW